MKQLQQQLTAQWQALAPRERKLVQIAAPVALVLMIVVAARGLLDWQQTLQQQVDSRAAQLTEMRQLEAAIRAAEGHLSGTPDIVVQRRGAELGLWGDGSSWQPAQRTAVLSERSFASLLRLLDGLEQDGVKAEALSLERALDGQVSGRIQFAGEPSRTP